ILSISVSRAYRLGRGEALAVAFLIAFSVFSFLPIWRQVEVAGMAMFGWLMAALMLLSPALALIVVVRDRRKRRGQ
ncbi:MAG: hypothetical protein P8Y44_05290, partial [Acidobacteriota bacterium]